MSKVTTKGPDPAEVASNVYTMILENDLVRVFDVRFKPGSKAKMHWHPNHVAYILEDGKLEITPRNGEVMKMAAKKGDAAWMDSGHHEAINKEKSDFHAIVVELKGNTKKISK